MKISRRSFVSGLLASPLTAKYAVAAQSVAPMKITSVETVYWKSRDDAPFWPHWTWVKIDTDAGISGIGETYPRNPVEAATPSRQILLHLAHAGAPAIASASVCEASRHQAAYSADVRKSSSRG